VDQQPCKLTSLGTDFLVNRLCWGLTFLWINLSWGLAAGEAAEYAQKSVKALGGMLGKDHPALESFWQAAADLLQKVRL